MTAGTPHHSQRRCRFKDQCKLAWPEWCPHWNKWTCPVRPTEDHRTPAGIVKAQA